MTVDILGAKYTVTVTNDGIEPRLNDCDGLCDETTREILAEDYQNKVTNDLSAKRDLEHQTKKVIRHEIVHAFLFESGLAENSPWALNEELVDWIAIQGPKIIRAWQEADAL